MLINLDKIIQLAWHDKTSFDEIKRKFNVSEKQVIDIMRNNLKLSSFKLWRKRVSGRRSKHQKKSEILSNYEKKKLQPHEIH
jgi:uncharacterized protein (TIGR03643 family)